MLVSENHFICFFLVSRKEAGIWEHTPIENHRTIKNVVLKCMTNILKLYLEGIESTILNLSIYIFNSKI